MERSKLYEGKLCGYCEVEKLKDEKLLDACDRAAEVILSHDWRDMQHKEGYSGPLQYLKLKELILKIAKLL